MTPKLKNKNKKQTNKLGSQKKTNKFVTCFKYLIQLGIRFSYAAVPAQSKL